MACFYTEHATAPAAEIRVVGNVTQHDMDSIIPRLKEFMSRHGTISIVEVIEGFDDFDPVTVFDGLEVDQEGLRDVTHAAVVSDVHWIGILSRAASRILPVSVRTFTMDQLDEARIWASNPI